MFFSGGGSELTYQVDEDLLAGFQGDLLAVVVDDGWLYDFAGQCNR